MNIQNKVAFINGGARIGGVVAEELAKRGCDVVLSYRTSRQAAQDVAENAQRIGVRTLVVKGNMTVAGDVQNVMTKIKRSMGRLDVVVNMASVYEPVKWQALDEKSWEINMGANLKSAFLSVKYAAPLLAAKGGGRVVNFADWVAASGRPRYKDFVPYYTAKFGVIGLTQAQALELAPHVLVNAIAPGPILPPKHITNAEVREVKKVTPLGKWGGAGEIAKAVLFLCETDFVTGECIRVDGGRHLY